ncbi:MAG: HD-GYP domain-containing protein, partial [Erythrobacter sp.]|nr:HD-GYP domain-containing protein [Erythrobacter sp.]
SEADMREYGMAGLLHDIGKMGVDDTILNKPGTLSEDEFERVRRHPEFGHAMLLKTANVPDMALDVCLHHHERIDGKGYPHKLAGDDLSEAARLGAICDVYDALTSDRAYKSAWTPIETVAAMWRWDGQFDRDLLFAFMQAMGIFPPGVIVELRSARLAVVLDNDKRNSRPRILAFHSLTNARPIEPEEIVIDDDFANEAIVGIVQPEDFGLTMAECRPDAIYRAWAEASSQSAVG